MLRDAEDNVQSEYVLNTTADKTDDDVSELAPETRLNDKIVQINTLG